MRLLVVLAGAAATLALAAAAAAKGPSAATIDGPGTGGGISLGAGADGGAVGSTHLADQAGLFPALFVQTPDPMLDTRPKGDLGPSYLVTYRLPGPNGSEDTIRQDVYPYAAGGPVTYTEPGQRFFETRTSHGGWYQASPQLKTLLVRAGLPASAPRGGASSDGVGFTDVWLPVALAFALALVTLSAVFVRRRPRTAAT